MEAPIEILSEHHAYKLVVDRALIDYFVFLDQLGHARSVGKQGNHDQACAYARRALQLWRGTALQEAEGARARNFRLRVFENEWLPGNASLIDSLIGRGQLTEAVAALNELEREHGPHLALAKLRLYAYYRQGRVQAAHEYRAQIRRHLRDNYEDDAADEIHRYHEELARAHGGKRERVVARPPLDQLPDAVSDFTGRADLLADLDTALTAGGRVLVLGGAGGIGKTALAVQWARRRPEFTDGRLYANLNGFSRGPKATASDVVDGFLSAFGVPADRLPTPEVRAAKLRELMSDRMVVLLDNVADSGQVLPLLPLFGGAVVLVTSRWRLVGLVVADGARVVTVGPLVDEHSVELLRTRIGSRENDPDALARLAAQCEGFPLALNLVGDHISARRSIPLSSFLARLRGPRLLTLGSHGDAGSTNLEAVFELSYLALDDTARRLFRLLGLHPGLEFSLAAANAIAGADVEHALDGLVDAHLLDLREDLDRFHFHDLLRGYAAVLAGQDDFTAERNAAIRRLLSFYLHSAFNANRQVFPTRGEVPLIALEDGVFPLDFRNADDAIRWFEAERACLSTVMRMAADIERHDYGWRIPQVVAPAFVRYGIGGAKEAWELAVASARLDGDEYGEGASLNNLGTYHLHLGDHVAAQPWFEIGLRFAERIANEFGIAVALHNLACVELACVESGKSEAGNSRHAVARELFERALDVATRCDIRQVEADAMHGLGRLHRLCGRLDEANKVLHHELWLRQKAKDVHGEGLVLTELGAVLAELGDHASALSHCMSAVDLLAGIRDLAGERAARLELARIGVTVSDRTAAEHAIRAVELSRLTWNRDSEAAALDMLARLRLLGGERDAAASAWSAAAAIYAERNDSRGQVVEACLAELAVNKTAMPEPRERDGRVVQADDLNR
ncbi:ATP-binding protein [Kutzneria chonburiensis]|uniref:ATP-binding protein n=1 Tax=Kutzneria chonburiensis TaxID=1483604 RepID=UPI00235DCA0C|nr:BTAD domain-containing putative transcriptional regulator [Kutzneria chonburiensis]